MTLPLPNPALNTLERVLWYTDRLVEAGAPLETIAGMDVRDLAALYRDAYEPISVLRDQEIIRLLRETKP